MQRKSCNVAEPAQMDRITNQDPRCTPQIEFGKQAQSVGKTKYRVLAE